MLVLQGLALPAFSALPADCSWRRDFQWAGTPDGTLVTQNDVRFDKANRILVHKEGREMFLLRGNLVIGHYPISLGFSPVGHKEKQGDGKTPEGRYFINFKNSKSKYYLSLKISYPDVADIEQAQKNGFDPGGEIYIHGFPTNPKEKAQVTPIHGKVDWTYGCVAVTDPEIEQIWQLVELGTPIDLCARLQ